MFFLRPKTGNNICRYRFNLCGRRYHAGDPITDTVLFDLLTLK